jgi:phosphoribosylanthranilate isomerase
MTAIKICGLKEPAHIEAAIHAGADMIGLVFFEKSPRNVTIDQAVALRKIIGERATVVALAVNPTDEFLKKMVKAVKPDLVQLHGDESPERVEFIQETFHVSVMKAIGIKTLEDTLSIYEYMDVADYILLDSKGHDLPGGNGIAFDWNLLDELDLSEDFMLSGGLNAGNVVEALTRTNVAAVDVSSGVESAPGLKDIKKIEAFIKAIREYDEQN